MVCLLAGGAAQAQTRYTESTDGTINETVTPCSTPLVRNFTVAAGTVTDIDIGVLLSHTYRSDLTMVLQAPNLTRVTFVQSIGGAADNFNVLLSSQNATSITAHTTNDTAAVGTVVPPYQRNLTYAPQNTLAAFNGLAAAGTWRLEICDTASGDSGTFYQADLYVTTGVVTAADLSLTQTINTSTPQSGAGVTYTLTVTNAAGSTGTATGITVQDTLPAAAVFRSASGTGTYDSATGVWSVGSLAPGASASIQIFTANNSVPATSVTNIAQITASSLPDPDSTVNNGNTGEDDYASIQYTTAAFPAAGTPPTFTCAAGTNAFDWDAQTWTNGALSRSFTIGGIATALNITGSTTRLQPDPATTSATPARNTSTLGGAAGQNSLMMAVDFVNNTENVNATWTFTDGVAGLRFTLADIDYYYGQFADRVTITGSYLGTSVTPTLTNHGANVVTGNYANGTALASNADATGNVIVTFDRPVDTVTINYGVDAANSPTDPGIQAIALMDMSLCSKATDLSLSKTVSNAAPMTNDALSYTLTVANATAAAMSATGITVSDVLPAGFTFTSASGTGSYNSGTGVWTIGTLAAGASATLTINGTVTAATGIPITNTAQITASSLPDPDSTANNGVTSEDDYAAVAFTASSSLPGPTCPAGGTIQAIANGTFASGTGPSWPSWTASAVWTGTGVAHADNDTTAGALSQSGLSGLQFGPSATGGTVIQLSQWWRNGAPAASSNPATLTVSLAGTDYARVTTPAGAGTSATITYLNGASGNLTTLTEFVSTGWRINIPTSVAATGALSFTHAPGGGTSDDFEIDNVTLYTCTPGQISVTKTSLVLLDGINASNHKAIPGATVEYCILVSNPGTVSLSNVVATDPLPTQFTYLAATITSGSACASAVTVEDDDTSGADESDPYGASVSGSTITATGNTLAPGQAIAIKFRGTIN